MGFCQICIFIFIVLLARGDSRFRASHGACLCLVWAVYRIMCAKVTKHVNISCFILYNISSEVVCNLWCHMFIAFIVFKVIRNVVSTPLSHCLIKSVGQSSSILTMLYSFLEQACQIVRIEGLLH